MAADTATASGSKRNGWPRPPTQVDREAATDHEPNPPVTGADLHAMNEHLATQQSAGPCPVHRRIRLGHGAMAPGG